MKNIEIMRNSWARIMQAHSVVMACHSRPDGDTLGSALALAHVLKAKGKEAVVVCEDELPENYAFLPESDTVQQHITGIDFDLGILVDSESPKRVGKVSDVITSASVTGCIDHHVPEQEFGNIRVVNVKASSTAEVVLDLLEANNIELDKIAATQLMTGLVSDTGAFKFANTSPKTLRAAARLTELGAHLSKIVREVYESRPLRAVKLLGRALVSLQNAADGRVVWTSITQRDMSELGATDADTDSVVNSVGIVKGSEVTMLFREVGPENIRISLRSRNGVDVNQIARIFGGGGHVAAAGCTINAPLADAEERVVAEVLKWMES